MPGTPLDTQTGPWAQKASRSPSPGFRSVSLVATADLSQPPKAGQTPGHQLPWLQTLPPSSEFMQPYDSPNNKASFPLKRPHTVLEQLRKGVTYTHISADVL